MLLHEFAHVDADHGVVVVEQEGRERFGQLGLADAGGPEEQERADGAVGILQAGARPAHGIRNRPHRLVLTDDTRFQRLFHLEQLFALAFQHLVDRNAGPARDDAAICSGVTASFTIAVFCFSSMAFSLLFEIRE